MIDLNLIIEITIDSSRLMSLLVVELALTLVREEA